MNHGSFSDDPETVWVTAEGIADRDMTMLKDFWFVDPAKVKWIARKGATINGASIPRALWTVVGSPYTGDYRRASIVHDIACDAAGNDRKKRLLADRMFYHACRAGGCSVWQSTILYIGVRIGAAASTVASWRAAVAVQSAGPRIHRTNDEVQIERDFQTIAETVLAAGETDDVIILEERVEGAIKRAAAV